MSHATLMHDLDEKIAQINARGTVDRDRHVATLHASGVHGMDNAPSSLFDYSKSSAMPAHRTGETVRDVAITHLSEWNEGDSVRPLMYDGNALMTFSVMLHASDHDRPRPHDIDDALGSHSEVADVEYEPDDAGDDLQLPDQVGYKESQQMGIAKSGKVDYITVEKIRHTRERVLTSLHKIDPSGMRRMAEEATSPWDVHIGRCATPEDLFNWLNGLPYANDRSTDVLVIASLVIGIPGSSVWLPALLAEHFEHCANSEEWRASNAHAYWRVMVDSYASMLSRYAVA